MSATSPTAEELKATLVSAFFGETALLRDLAMSSLRQHAIQAMTTAEILSIQITGVLPNNFPTRETGWGASEAPALRLVKPEDGE